MGKMKDLFFEVQTGEKKYCQTHDQAFDVLCPCCVSDVLKPENDGKHGQYEIRVSRRAWDGEGNDLAIYIAYDLVELRQTFNRIAKVYGMVPVTTIWRPAQ